MRRTVLVGASLLRDAGAGVLDAVSELSAAQGQSAQLERELELARQQGRWLSDDERAELLIQDQRRAQRRRTLLLLAVAGPGLSSTVGDLAAARREQASLAAEVERLSTQLAVDGVMGEVGRNADV